MFYISIAVSIAVITVSAVYSGTVACTVVSIVVSIMPVVSISVPIRWTGPIASVSSMIVIPPPVRRDRRGPCGGRPRCGVDEASVDRGTHYYFTQPKYN